MTGIIFQNPGLIDLRAVTTMGLNVKPEAGDNPIGFFGTGLKFAIATILRGGGTIDIYRGVERASFYVRKEDFRGKEFDFIYMKTAGNMRAGIERQPTDRSLGITTELGKNWEPWMAIRELESNVRDERGKSWLQADRTTYGLPAESTTIIVTGEAFVKAYESLDDIFCASPIKYSSEKMEVRQQAATNRTNIYYRGILAGKWSHQPLFRYNLLASQTLTEDRTIKYSWMIDNEVRNFWIQKCDDEQLLTSTLMAPDGTVEHEIDFDVDIEPSAAFLKVVEELGPKANKSAWHFFRKHKKLTNWDEVPLDEYNGKLLQQAREFLVEIGFDTSAHEVKVASNLGEDVMGCVHAGQIWIALRTFEMGKKQLISTLLEEFIHKDRGYADHSYSMQNFLFDTIIGLGARYVTKEPL